MHYELIIFDCDGTLVDSEYINNKVSVDLLTDFGVTDYNVEGFMQEFAGKTWSDIRRTIEGRHNVKLPDDMIETYIKTVNEALEGSLQPIKGAKDFVVQCAQNRKICVASNGQRENVFKSLAVAGFMPKHFQEDNIFTRIQVENAKPAPDLFLFAADEMGVAPDKCLVIEDSVTGVSGAVAAEMDVWGCTAAAHDSKKAEKTLIKAGASRIFNNFIHIAEALGY